ncbi:blastula protease 10-like [Gigantopelta aegis]|uniref:blastula protease 10-like n=1 Tax=Gigantopelta aegis TaxID=1735272 RepID=UPI001B887EBB|nr:blastula protease 10-like [Gigantopelta aegis]
MQLISVIAVYLLGNVVMQSSAHITRMTKRQAGLKAVQSHSPLNSQADYPNNPIMLESPRSFALPNQLRGMRSIDEYIVGGYNNSGGYDRASVQTDGTVILEYDMKITNTEYRAYYHGNDNSLVQSATSWISGNRRFRRKALLRPGSHWPGAIIPYQITKDYSQDDIEILKQSMKAWEDRTCIRFVPAQPHHRNILRLQSERGCNSFIGMVGGIQQLNLSKSCRVKHVVTHELGHVIGLIHEHQRPDRDSYLKILTKYVAAKNLKNFRKFRPERVTSFGVKYDYTSIMHYGKKAFSKGGKFTTMVTLDSRFQDVIGKARKISFSDAKVVNLMYDCAGACMYVNYHCTTGYMDHTCRCVCRDGTQGCVQSLQPVEKKPVNLPLSQILRYLNLVSTDDDEGKWSFSSMTDFGYKRHAMSHNRIID